MSSVWGNRLKPVAGTSRLSFSALCKELKTMQTSQVIEVDGVFVGTAIAWAGSDERTFFAIDERVRPLHQRIVNNLAEIERLAKQQLRAPSARAA